MRLTHRRAIAFAFTLLALDATRASAAFSSLPPERQKQLRRMVQPPPLAQRAGPYSVPMYYLMHKGYEYRGDEDKGPEGRCYINGGVGPDFGSWKLDRNRPDWQEAMLRDFAELGLNNTHLNLYPQNGSLELDADYRNAIEEYARLSEKFGLKIGVRLDALGGAVAWEMNPANSGNQIKPYLTWARSVARLLRGRTAYYVLGDELTLHERAPDDAPKAWTAENYLAYFRQVSTAIKEEDPAAKVSMFAASSGEWFNVLYLLKRGYAQHGDAVAINYPDYREVPRFFADAQALAPRLMFLSNGVGYCSLGTVSPRYPEGDPYSKLPSEESHAAAVAKSAFAWWDLGAATAPYYVSLRNWVIDGKTYPRWFGFFGFEDYVVDADKLTVRRYPAWYALRTITHTFYDREQFTTPAFPVAVSKPITMFKAYEHRRSGGRELVLMLWNEDGLRDVTIELNTQEFGHAVRIPLTDCDNWQDVASAQEAGKTRLTLQIGAEPVILRLFGEER